jgi:hypothetical protein
MRALTPILLLLSGCGFDSTNPEYACGSFPGRSCLQYSLFFCDGVSGSASLIDQLEFIDHSTPQFISGGMVLTPPTPSVHDLKAGPLVVALVPDRNFSGNLVSFDVQPFFQGNPFENAPPVSNQQVQPGQHVVAGSAHECFNSGSSGGNNPCSMCQSPACCALGQTVAQNQCVPAGNNCPNGMGTCTAGQCGGGGCCAPGGSPCVNHGMTCIAPIGNGIGICDLNGCCGEANMQCCQTQFQSGAGCDANLVCSGGMCKQCGGNSQPCCAGSNPCPTSTNHNCTGTPGNCS